MGKKSKSSERLAKVQERKNRIIAALPPPPGPPEKEMGSAKTLAEPSMPGMGFKVIDGPGYDDGGVADLSLLIDLEDSVQRRKRGDAEYFTALHKNLLPRATRGPMSRLSRRDQKVSLAQLLFSEDEDLTNTNGSDVFTGISPNKDDKVEYQEARERLAQARVALRMSMLLREPACCALSLCELCKRRLVLEGKDGGEAALRCAIRALEISGDGFYDSDEVALEAQETPEVDPNYERNATSPGLAHPTTLKLLPARVSLLCKRSALLQYGNALAAMGKEEEAREYYNQVVPLMRDEPRCARLDWERHTIFINLGNSFSRSGQFDKADEQFNIAEGLGTEHVKSEFGSTVDGKSMVIAAKRARSFALKKAGREDEAKALLKEVLSEQIELNAEQAEEKKKKIEAAKAAREAEEERLVKEQEAAEEEVKKLKQQQQQQQQQKKKKKNGVKK